MCPLPSLFQRRSRLLQCSHLLVAFVALLAATLIGLVNIPRALACPVCIAPDKITLSGDGIAGTATITDGALLESFGAATFMGFEERSPVPAPAYSGSGIELTRYYENTGVPDSFWTQGFDHMRYYPGAQGQPGYVFYEGSVSAEARDYAQGLNMAQRAGHWFQVNSDEDVALRALLAAAHANPQNSAVSAPPPMTSTPPDSTPLPAILRALGSIPLPVIILVVCPALLVASVGYRLVRSHQHRVPLVPVKDTVE